MVEMRGWEGRGGEEKRRGENGKRRGEEETSRGEEDRRRRGKEIGGEKSIAFGRLTGWQWHFH